MSDLFQSVPFAVVLLIIGFVFLVKGADAFVEGCSSIARRYQQLRETMHLQSVMR